MKRGEVWLATLDPTIGSEANKTRPVVVVTNDGANGRATQLGRGTLTVVPVTSNVTRQMSFHVLLQPGHTGLSNPSKAQPEHIRSIDVTRLTRKIGRVDPRELAAIDDAIRLHLSL
jgi:mRNA interferase MazF